SQTAARGVHVTGAASGIAASGIAASIIMPPVPPVPPLPDMPPVPPVPPVPPTPPLPPTPPMPPVPPEPPLPPAPDVPPCPPEPPDPPTPASSTACPDAQPTHTTSAIRPSLHIPRENTRDLLALLPAWFPAESYPIYSHLIGNPAEPKFQRFHSSF